MDTTKKTIVFVTGAALVLALIFAIPQFRRFLLTQVAVEITLQKNLTLTIPQNAAPGQYSFQIDIEDESNQGLLARSEPLTVVVQDSNPPSTEPAANSGGQSDGGGGGGGSGGPPPIDPIKTYAFAPERDHVVQGSYSGVMADGNREVVKLAHQQATLTKQIKVPTDQYWLYIEAKDDRPGPVKIAVYINNQAWKVVTLNKQDDNYRVYRVGLLRQFPGAKITFRLVDDTYDKQDPTNERKDRNAFIDSWAVSTNVNLEKIHAAKETSKLSGPNLKTGTHLLPGLNNIIRQELGARNVNRDIWSYYARRLAATPNKREAIGTEEKLRAVMKFWLAVNPTRPRGEL